MAKIERFGNLRCWHASGKFVNAIYTICRTGELNKDFDTKSQLKKASGKKEVYNMRVNLPGQFLKVPWNNQNFKTLTQHINTLAH